MSHGNVYAHHIGTCETCGREDQPLREARHKAGRFVCTDEFGCFKQWQLNRGIRNPEPLDPRVGRQP